jgi:hypothetical protein
MNRPAQILGAVALAYLGGACGSGTGPEPDAGLLLDAGFHYTALSQGIATLSGAFTGTASVDGFAFSIPTGFPLLDGGNSGPYVYAQVSNAVPASGPSFGCSFNLYFSTTLDAGIYTPTNVRDLQCIAEYDPADGGASEFWGNIGVAFGPPSVFEWNLTSPGPASVFSSGTNWFDPSGTIYVYMAPGPEQVNGFGFSVTVAPPPCPAYCAPNSQ